MDLKRKLQRLASKAAATVAPAPDAPREGSAVDEALRESLKRRQARVTHARLDPSPVLFDDDAWPFAPVETEHGVVHRRTVHLPVTARHGHVPLHRALDAHARDVATLALDEAFTAVDLTRALYLDTETTGLAGGTGTVPFLVGCGWFEGRSFVIEQSFVAALDDEEPLLRAVAARMADASALVTFNGRTFDVPLLRARLALSRVPAVHEPPHLDLLHIARRIYKARVDDCRLGTLERDVLGFVRVDDVGGAEIPERYQRYLREGDRARGPLVPVARHNEWDIAALAALVGELAARVARAPTEGSLHPQDLLGLARTALRAGRHDLTRDLAYDAARAGDSPVARDAHMLAARSARQSRDPDATLARLRDALAHAPDDPRVHLDLAKCYEREHDDPARALAHALRARGAEEPAAWQRRVRRLERRVRAGVQLALPHVR